MKKTILLILIVLAFSVSCKNKEIIGSEYSGNIGTGGKIPKINITIKQEDVDKSLEGIYNSAIATTGNDWKNAGTLLTDIDLIRHSILITKLEDKYYVLRITSTGDVQIGLEDRLTNAIKQSEYSNNLDPRKFVWQFEPTATKSNINDNGLKVNGRETNIRETYDRVILVWLGRIFSNNPFSGTEPNVYYDLKYTYALKNSGSSTYKLEEHYKAVYYKDLGLSEALKAKEQETFSPLSIDSAFFWEEIEPHAKGGKRAWAYRTDYMRSNGKGHKQVCLPHMTRYGDSVDEAPEKLYLSGYNSTNKRGSKIISVDVANTNFGLPPDTRAPSGRAVLGINIGGTIPTLFFSTVVGFNLRTQEFTDKDIKGVQFTDSKGNTITIDKDRLRKVIVEFDESTCKYTDARVDGWDNNVYNFPKYKQEAQKELEEGGTRKTYKVPFILIKGEQ